MKKQTRRKKEKKFSISTVHVQDTQPTDRKSDFT